MGKSEQCPPQQLLWNTLWQNIAKHSKFSFYNTVYSAHNENETEYPGTDMYRPIGEPLLWMTPYFIAKSSHRIKINRLLEQVLLFPRVLCSAVSTVG